MRCPRCQHENRPQAKFCEDCGSRLTLTCAQCGGDLAPGKRFCGSCGAPAAGESTARTVSPESYTPKHLAEKILTSKSALEGERKQVTVLFADLKGSMELLADRDPEEARKLLDPVLERMMDAVHRYEGTVNQVMGDGIMALFGAPIAHEDHAVRACYAALDLQVVLRRYAEEIRRTQGVKLEIRAGLNSGEVVVRAVGSDLRMDYSAVGQTTHVAARMEQFADPGSTLLTAATLRLAEGFVEVKPLGPVPVKGVDTPIEVYELVGTAPLRSRFQAAASRGLTRFVGRERELEQLRVALDQAAASHGQVVAIVGEPGVGKSRFVWEVTHSHRTHGWLIVQAGSVSYGKTTPYLPLIDLLKSYFKIDDRDDQRVIREKVIGKLLALDRTLEPTLPAFLALLDVPTGDPTWEALDPSQRRQRTLAAVTRLLLRESHEHPVLVIFEDLHWIDTGTQAFLDGFVEHLPTARLLLLVNYRPEYGHRWGSKTYYTQLRLDPLPPASAHELLEALLGSSPEVGPIKPLLIERTEGNPFFLEESIQTLVETGALIGERGSYRAAKTLGTIHVPATVQAVLASRIDRLPPDEKRLLQSASVIGTHVPFTLLQAIADLSEDEIKHGLSHLQTAEFLYEARLFPDLEYTFKHALTHEVAYGSLLRERRRALHSRIAESLEAGAGDRQSEIVESLAHHALRGELWSQAISFLRQAGAKAMTGSIHREAVSSFEQALSALEHVPESRERLELAIDLRFELRTALISLGEFERIRIILGEAETLAERMHDLRRLAQASIYMGISSYVSGQSELTMTSVTRALALAETIDDGGLQAVANQYLGFAQTAKTNFQQASEYFDRAIALLGGTLSRERLGLAALPSVQSRAFRAWVLAELGMFPESIPLGEEGIRIAESVKNPNSLAFACWGAGRAWLCKGDLKQAIACLERPMATAAVLNFRYLAPPLGSAYALSGRINEALALLEQADNLDARMNYVAHHALTVVVLGETYLLAGRASDATVHATRALTLSRERREPGHEAYAHRLLGEIAAQADPPDLESADAHYSQALALATERGMRPLVAHCHLGLGKLYRRTGDHAKAEEHLTTARAMYREMDMGFYLTQVETV